MPPPQRGGGPAGACDRLDRAAFSNARRLSWCALLFASGSRGSRATWRPDRHGRRSESLRPVKRASSGRVPSSVPSLDALSRMRQENSRLAKTGIGSLIHCNSVVFSGQKALQSAETRQIPVFLKQETGLLWTAHTTIRYVANASPQFISGFVPRFPRLGWHSRIFLRLRDAVPALNGAVLELALCCRFSVPSSLAERCMTIAPMGLDAGRYRGWIVPHRALPEP